MADLKLTEKRFTLVHLGITALIGLVAVAAVLINCIESQPSTSSPIKVRGGSMTFRNVQKWNSAASNTYCTDNPDISYIEFKKVSADNSNPDGKTTFPGLSSNWSIQFLGHDPRSHYGKDPSKNGILVTAQFKSNKDCSGTNVTSESIIKLTPIGPYGDFYPLTYSADDDGSTHSVRFMDKMPDQPAANNSPAVPGCQGPSMLDPKLSGDEDVCEHISKITLTLNYTDVVANQKIYNFKCPNGECEVGIGGP